MLVKEYAPGDRVPSFHVEIFIHVGGIRRNDSFIFQVAGPDDITDNLQVRIDAVINDTLMRTASTPKQECVGICILKSTHSGERFFMFIRFSPLRRAELMQTYMHELTAQIGAYLCGDSSYNQVFSGTPH